MADDFGFKKHSRQTMNDRPLERRLDDWKNFHKVNDDKLIKKQASRCMNCGVPFCQTGTLYHNLTSGCPLKNLIPEWNDLVFKGKWRLALERLHKTNNFPEFTGNICPAPCESACVLAINDKAVTIKNIEQAIIDKGFEQGWIKPQIPKNRTDKKIAIIGSGPAGLAAAQQLNRAGHRVSVYEREDRIGGLLMYGIPAMKLEKSIVDRRVNLLRQEGIEFITSTEVGKDIEREQLQETYDAIIITTGANKPKQLLIPGHHLQGIHFAMEFLTKTTKSLLNSNFKDQNFIDAKDKDVIVIGAGDTGTDCIATCLRLQCKSLRQFANKPRPPNIRSEDNPWPQWAHIYALDYGHEEADYKFGGDPREFYISTKDFIDDGHGHVRGLTTATIHFEKDAAGQLQPIEIPNTERCWPAQLVLLAMGFKGPDSLLIDNFNLCQDDASNILAPYHKYTATITKTTDSRRLFKLPPPCLIIK